MTQASETQRSWIVLSAVSLAWSFSLLTVMVALLPAITTFIVDDTGWSRTQVTGAMVMMVIAGALMSPGIGAVMDRRGARIVIISGQVVVIAALLALAFFGQNFVAYYVCFAVAGLATAALTPTTYMRVISQWFDERRGMAMGIAAFGSSLLAIALPLVGVAIATQYGWKANFVVLAIASIVLALPAQVLFIRDRAPPSPRPRVGENLIKAIVTLWSQEPLVRTLTATFLLIGIGQTAILFALPPMLTDRGMTPEAAAGAQAVAGISTIFGKLAGGYLFDRFRSARPVMIGLAFAVAGMLGLAAGAIGPAAYVCALLIGLSAGIENDAPPYLVSRYFDITVFGKVAATITTLAISALAIGPVGGSALRDLSGSYTATCLAAVGVLLIAGWLTLRLPGFPRPHAAIDAKGIAEAL